MALVKLLAESTVVAGLLLFCLFVSSFVPYLDSLLLTWLQSSCLVFGLVFDLVFGLVYCLLAFVVVPYLESLLLS